MDLVKKILLFLLFILFPRTLLADELAIILREGIKPYLEVLKGFEGCTSHPVSKYYLSADKAKKEQIVKKIQSKKPDLILAIGEDSLKLAIDNFKGIPILYTMVFSPFSLVDKESTHITGICMEVDTKHKFETLKQIMPQAKRIGVVYNPIETMKMIKKAKADAEELGMELVAVPISSTAEFFAAINSLGDKVDAFWMILDSTFLTQKTIEHMLLWSFRQKIPLIGLSEKYVKLGSLFSLSFEPEDIGKYTCQLFRDNIINGKTQARSVICDFNWKLSLNLMIARKLGITIPEEIKQRAHMIYE